MELAVQWLWWWWWGAGCKAMRCWQAPGAESYLSGRGWPGSQWGTEVLDGKPLELQAQSPLSFRKTVPLAYVSVAHGMIGVHTCAHPLTDQTLRQELCGPDWEGGAAIDSVGTWGPGFLDTWASEAKTASRSQYFSVLLSKFPETIWDRAFRKRVLELLILKERVPKKAESDSYALLPMWEKASPGIQPPPPMVHMLTATVSPL